MIRKHEKENVEKALDNLKDAMTIKEKTTIELADNIPNIWLRFLTAVEKSR
ncbi:hypothetical protein ACFL1G_08055 [Planctomycetota bacterium]